MEQQQFLLFSIEKQCIGTFGNYVGKYDITHNVWPFPSFTMVHWYLTSLL